MKQLLKQYRIPLLLVLIFLALSVFAPEVAVRSSRKVGEYFMEMILIIPPVFILMGIMDVWLPKDKVQKWMGRGSGMSGTLLALVLGTLPTGPLYVAFPMAAALLKKGASVHNMVIFLGSWAALKIPQLLVETKFLGLAFTLARFALTLLMLLVTGYIMQGILGKEGEKHWLPDETDEMVDPMKKMRMEKKTL
ncbi:MAG: permease [Sphaerochaetaceae bacterium]|nr:permease [Sphaerochaetaceae bacterium]